MLKVYDNKLHDSEIKLSDQEQRFYDFLNGAAIGVISSTDPNGDPHGAVIYYSIDKNFVIEFLTKSHTKKYDNITRNNHIMLTVFDALTQTTVQVTGLAKEIKNDSVLQKLVKQVFEKSLRTSEAGQHPLSKLDAGNYVGFKIEPVQIRMAVYARPDPGEYSEIFETIDSFEQGSLEINR